MRYRVVLRDTPYLLSPVQPGPSRAPPLRSLPSRAIPHHTKRAQEQWQQTAEQRLTELERRAGIPQRLTALERADVIDGKVEG